MLPFQVAFFNRNQVDMAGGAPAWLWQRELVHGDRPDGGIYNTNVVEVARKGAFWTPQDSLTQPTVRWSLTRSGPYVRIPLCSYDTGQRAHSVVIALAAQLGMIAVDDFRVRFGAVPIEKVIMMVGDELQDLAANPHPRDGLRFHVGLSIQVKE